MDRNSVSQDLRTLNTANDYQPNKMPISNVTGQDNSHMFSMPNDTINANDAQATTFLDTLDFGFYPQPSSDPILSQSMAHHSIQQQQQQQQQLLLQQQQQQQHQEQLQRQQQQQQQQQHQQQQHLQQLQHDPRVFFSNNNFYQSPQQLQQMQQQQNYSMPVFSQQQAQHTPQQIHFPIQQQQQLHHHPQHFNQQHQNNQILLQRYNSNGSTTSSTNSQPSYVSNYSPMAHYNMSLQHQQEENINKMFYVQHQQQLQQLQQPHNQQMNKSRRAGSELLVEDHMLHQIEGGGIQKKKTKGKKKKGPKIIDPNAPPKPKRKTGLNKPLILSPALSELMDGDKELSRPELVQKLWRYIKDNDLQDPADRRFILCDAKLKKIFDQDRINSFGMNKDLSAHLTKKEEPIVDVKEEEVDEAAIVVKLESDVKEDTPTEDTTTTTTASGTATAENTPLQEATPSEDTTATPPKVHKEEEENYLFDL